MKEKNEATEGTKATGVKAVEVERLVSWVPNNSQYCSGKSAMLGKWVVGEIYWDGTVSKGSDLNQKAKCFLPGIKNDLGNFKTEDEAKKTIIFAIGYWLDKAGTFNN